ncbi:class I SAM-dependent methyltransferase [Rhodospira trueperi]|uniref:Ubiquinone biosynthesis O-methyltransferase n=1 Tax=Rhodospira trueperi TaxID=69960 RepID=A0A1G6WTU6_9PROT|nr:methyltransferase domain-containing protein [Rhodospira trueperi]SDD69302.1 ubiquinone biosynthesis O-methyltransferase [Rhodospira trueperi]
MAEKTEAPPEIEELPAAYARWRDSRLGRITDSLEHDLILDRVGAAPGLRILDVGCGDGLLAMALAGQGAHVTGLDASPRMIAAARKRPAPQRGGVSFDIGQADALPFEADTFDGVVSITALCFVADPGGAVREMVRVLKPGGRLIIGTLGRHSAWAAIRRVRGWLGHPIWSRARFATPQGLKRLAEEAGLEEARVTGSIYYPPVGPAARALGPIDRAIGTYTTFGAAFLVLAARKP